jgi:uncharacterized protein YfaP (DUF2135 family)
MASYQVMSWRGIPSQVNASDETGATVRVSLPAFFQQEIDRVAMAEGLVETDAYLEGWSWSELADRRGTATEVAEAVAIEVADAWRTANSRSTP